MGTEIETFVLMGEPWVRKGAEWQLEIMRDYAAELGGTVMDARIEHMSGDICSAFLTFECPKGSRLDWLDFYRLCEIDRWRHRGSPPMDWVPSRCLGSCLITQGSSREKAARAKLRGLKE